MVGGQVKTPNLPWVVDSANIARRFKLDSIALLNDLEAAAYGIFTLEVSELFTLNEGVSGQRGNKVLIAAGTGLGRRRSTTTAGPSSVCLGRRAR